MNDAKTCPKCQHPMAQGFIDKRIPEPNYISQWVEGKPERSFWKGLKVSPEKSYPITTYRCVSCGFLEAYALR
jgi:predicted nucleic-acid-binding Zn-ribbon protein